MILITHSHPQTLHFIRHFSSRHVTGLQRVRMHNFWRGKRSIIASCLKENQRTTSVFNIFPPKDLNLFELYARGGSSYHSGRVFFQSHHQSCLAPTRGIASLKNTPRRTLYFSEFTYFNSVASRNARLTWRRAWLLTPSNWVNVMACCSLQPYLPVFTATIDVNGLSGGMKFFSLVVGWLPFIAPSAAVFVFHNFNLKSATMK